MGFEFVKTKREKPNREDYFNNRDKNTVIYYGQVEAFINAQDEFIEYQRSIIEAVKKAIEK